MSTLSFLEPLTPLSKEASRIVRYYCKNEPLDVFLPKKPTPNLKFTSHGCESPVSTCYSDTPSLLRIRNDTVLSRYFLPIEFFKNADLSCENVTFSVQKKFVSSGTTESGRSLASFSAEGMALYKIAAVSTFYSVLRHYFLDPMGVHGVSLIPPAETWPDSSLSQMVTWISEHWPVYFSRIENFHETLKFIKGPVFLMGTAYHLIWLIESTKRVRLPFGSIIIETGGYKGKSRELPRGEFYDALARHFDLSLDYIVSEYGMCEAACQAYDFIANPQPDRPTPLEERSFALPSWVTPYVTQRGGYFQFGGEGALVLDDPMRIDYPWPLRTQDFAHLSKERLTFKLLGRVTASVLKGCSLSADIDNGAFIIPAPRLPKELETLNFDVNSVRKRAQTATRVLEDIMSDPKLLDYLTSEMGSRSLGQSAIHDIMYGMPKSLDSWRMAAGNSIGEKDVTAVIKNWLIILPRSHSLALFHPMFLGYVLGLQMFVRKTTTVIQMVESYVLDRLSSLEDSHFIFLPPDFTIGRYSLPFQDGALLAFGADETIKRLAVQSGLPINGFGTVITGSVVYASELRGLSADIAKDCYSLAQNGCFSSRYIVVLEDAEAGWLDDETISLLVNDGKAFIGANLTSLTNTATDHELFRLSLLGARVPCWESLDEPLFAVWPEPLRKIADIGDRLARTTPATVLFTVQQPIDANELVSGLLHTNEFCSRVSVSPKVMKELRFAATNENICALGKANAPIWNGRHQGRPLFKPISL